MNIQYYTVIIVCTVVFCVHSNALNIRIVRCNFYCTVVSRQESTEGIQELLVEGTQPYCYL